MARKSGKSRHVRPHGYGTKKSPSIMVAGVGRRRAGRLAGRRISRGGTAQSVSASAARPATHAAVASARQRVYESRVRPNTRAKGNSEDQAWATRFSVYGTRGRSSAARVKGQ